MYSPGLGRWVNRDPIEERDSSNLFLSLRNAPTIYFDMFGLFGALLIPLRPPATPLKCSLAATAMALGAASTPANTFLWGRWLDGTGGEQWVSYDWFDPLGIWRRASREVVENMLDHVETWAAGLSCNQTEKYTDSFTMSAEAGLNLMINAWQQTTDYYITYGKDCDNCRCTKLWASATYFNSADDRTDFNDGASFAAPPFLIEDSLINDCFGSRDSEGRIRNDFDIRSTRSGVIERSWKCP